MQSTDPQPLIRSLGPKANPANLGPALNSALLWGAYATYLAVVMASGLPPGPPAWATPPEVLAEAFDESVNIFWIKWVTCLGSGSGIGSGGLFVCFSNLALSERINHPAFRSEALRNLHLSPIPVTPHHPVSEVRAALCS